MRTRTGEKGRDPGCPQQRHRGRERSRFRTLRPEAARREVPRLPSRLVMRGVGLLTLPYTEPSPESKSVQMRCDLEIVSPSSERSGVRGQKAAPTCSQQISSGLAVSRGL